MYVYSTIHSLLTPNPSPRTALHLDLDEELCGFFSQWEIEELQEATEDFGWDLCLHRGWVSTEEFVDTKERTGFLTATSQGGLVAESNIEDDALSDDLSDGEDAPDRESALRRAVLGMTHSGR